MWSLNVGEIMTSNLRTMHEDDAVSTADWEMALDEIRHIIVVDEGGRLAGIVSDRDVLRAARDVSDREIPIGRIMCRDVQTVEASTPAAEAVDKMLAGKYSALPVVDDKGRPIGIVTTTDFLEVARRALVGRDVTPPAGRRPRSVH
jgi:CBS domain-containing protein